MPRKASAPTPITQAPPAHLEVRVVRLDTLTPDPHNVRLHPEKNVKAIVDSLAAFGQQKPVIVDAHGTILAGNGAYLAAKRLGWEWLTVQVSQLTPDQARAYALADNRTGELSLWDDAALAELLRDLSARELPLPGWDEAELRRLCDASDDAGRAARPGPCQRAARAVRRGAGPGVAVRPPPLGCGDCTDEQVVRRCWRGRATAHGDRPPYGVNYTPEWRNEAAGRASCPMRPDVPGTS